MTWTAEFPYLQGVMRFLASSFLVVGNKELVLLSPPKSKCLEHNVKYIITYDVKFFLIVPCYNLITYI
jgi:hypothetical protein